MMLLRLLNLSLIGALLASTVSAQSAGANPPCYLCGGDKDATIGKPDVLITLPAGSPISQATCGQLDAAARQGFLTPDQCTEASSNKEGQAKCACSNYVAPTAPVAPPPVASPTRPPPTPVARPTPVPPPPTPVATPPTPVATSPMSPVPMPVSAPKPTSGGPLPGGDKTKGNKTPKPPKPPKGSMGGGMGNKAEKVPKGEMLIRNLRIAS